MYDFTGVIGSTGIQTRVHLIKQEQTERELLFVMEMDFKHATHYFAQAFCWNWKRINISASLAPRPLKESWYPGTG